MGLERLTTDHAYRRAREEERPQFAVQKIHLRDKYVKPTLYTQNTHTFFHRLRHPVE